MAGMSEMASGLPSLLFLGDENGCPILCLCTRLGGCIKFCRASHKGSSAYWAHLKDTCIRVCFDAGVMQTSNAIKSQT